MSVSGVMGSRRKIRCFTVTLLVWSGLNSVHAAVLPEERSDVLLHSYSGGGIDITGPSVLVRKQFGQSFSAFANYYIDSITSASIDVEMIGASEYTEERTETAIGIDYLHGKSTMSLSVTNSEENDFKATSAHFGISMDMFGDLTTVSLGYSYGDDEISATGIPDFLETAKRQNYRLGLTQILTKNLALSANLETITDEGYLQNPYRRIRVADDTVARGWSLAPEDYPNTRTSNAISLSARYYLSYRAALKAQTGFFADTWGISAYHVELGYIHPFKEGWLKDITMEVSYRYYNQGQADFYRDLFAREGELTFSGRDKELSAFTDQTIGIGASYEFAKGGWGFIDKGSVNLKYNLIQFDYDNFLDARESDQNPLEVPAGGESPYNFLANVIQLFVSIWY